MRIAYVAPYQGPSLVNARPVVANLSLAGSVKIEIIAKLLAAQRHDVEIISQGEVVELACKWYPAITEAQPFDPAIPIYYASALPVRFLNGLWSSKRTLSRLKARHRRSPYDLMIIYNLKLPQIACAEYAIRQLGLPVIFEYEDDAFVDLSGNRQPTRLGFGVAPATLLPMFSGCIAASPHLLSQVPGGVPKLLLRGVIGNDLLQASQRMAHAKQNWVLYSGTHYRSKGIKQLIEAWREMKSPGWELHITGYGELTDALKSMAKAERSIVFHGLVSRQELVDIMCSAKICINPHDVSDTPGNVFAFKLIEYLAAGAQVVSTPMGAIEPEIEKGITYMDNNDPGTIKTTLERLMKRSEWSANAADSVIGLYGPSAVTQSLSSFLEQAIVHR